MGNGRVNLAVFYAALFPILVVSVLVGIGVGSTNIDWRTILHVAGLKLLPAGWVSSAGITTAAGEAKAMD